MLFAFGCYAGNAVLPAPLMLSHIDRPTVIDASIVTLPAIARFAHAEPSLVCGFAEMFAGEAEKPFDAISVPAGTAFIWSEAMFRTLSGWMVEELESEALGTGKNEVARL